LFRKLAWFVDDLYRPEYFVPTVDQNSGMAFFMPVHPDVQVIFSDQSIRISLP